MSKKTALVAIAVLAVLALAGCVREDGTYVLNEDNTVDGTIVLAMAIDETNPTPPPSMFDAADIASGFAHATVTNLGQPGWVGDRITFVDEPIATFSTAVDDWEISVSRVGTQYVVAGAPIDPADAATKQNVIDEGGSMDLSVTFPGPVAEHNGTLSGTTVTWDMLTQDAAPYARGSAVPQAPPAAPDPVVTVVVSPHPTPHASPTPTVIITPSASPSAIAAPDDSGNASIPVWVWIVGGVLLAAIVGLGSFMIASRTTSGTPAPPEPKPEPEPEVDAEPEADTEPEPGAKPAKAKTTTTATSDASVEETKKLPPVTDED